MPENLEERINRLKDRVGPSIDAGDLPDSHVGPGSYYTDEDRDWNHERQIRHLSARDPAKVVTPQVK